LARAPPGPSPPHPPPRLHQPLGALTAEGSRQCGAIREPVPTRKKRPVRGTLIVPAWHALGGGIAGLRNFAGDGNLDVALGRCNTTPPPTNGFWGDRRSREKCRSGTTKLCRQSPPTPPAFLAVTVRAKQALIPPPPPTTSEGRGYHWFFLSPPAPPGRGNTRPHAPPPAPPGPPPRWWAGRGVCRGDRVRKWKSAAIFKRPVPPPHPPRGSWWSGFTDKCGQPLKRETPHPPAGRRSGAGAGRTVFGIVKRVMGSLGREITFHWRNQSQE